MHLRRIFNRRIMSIPTLLTQERSISSTVQPKSFWYKSFTQGEIGGRFSFQEDTYKGVILQLTESVDSRMEAEEFRSRMILTIKFLQEKGYSKGLWLKVGRLNAHLVPILVEEFSFDFHHVDKGTSLTLSRWLSGSSPSGLPDGASHSVGVGAVVTDGEGRVLLVREKSGPAGRMRIWKFPTGRVERGEDLSEAVVRELKEEVGLDSNFKGVLMVREGHGGADYLGELSDLFFVCLLEASNHAGDLVLQPEEIEEAKWVHVSELPEVCKYPNGSSGEAMIDCIGNFFQSGHLPWTKSTHSSWRQGQPHTIFRQ